jgi:hypothetical protein
VSSVATRTRLPGCVMASQSLHTAVCTLLYVSATWGWERGGRVQWESEGVGGRRREAGRERGSEYVVGWVGWWADG